MRILILALLGSLLAGCIIFPDDHARDHDMHGDRDHGGYEDGGRDHRD